MNALLSVLCQKSIKLTIKSTLLLIADKCLLKYISFNSVVLKQIKECCEEEEEKYEEIQKTFGTAYLRNRWTDSFQI